jgi:hypothetical protein
MQVFREDIEARFSSHVVLGGSLMTRNSVHKIVKLPFEQITDFYP